MLIDSTMPEESENAYGQQTMGFHMLAYVWVMDAIYPNEDEE